MFIWPIWNLLNTVFGSILEVFLLCIAGYVLARQGILDKKTQKQINRLNVSLCTPSLLFSKVAFFLSPSKLKELWIIPIVFVVTTFTSMVVAYVFGSILRLKKSQRSFAIAASMFMNSNSLPIAIMQSLVYTVPQLRWGDDDDKNVMLGRALTYLVLYSTLGMMLRWSYGVRLLSQADDEVTPDPEQLPEPTEVTPLISTDSPQSTSYIYDRSADMPPLLLTHAHRRSLTGASLVTDQHYSIYDLANSNHAGTLSRDEPSIPPKFFQSFPNTPGGPRSETSSESEIADEIEWPVDNTPRWRLLVWTPLRTLLHKVNNFMTVPMWAALASLIVACVQPLQHTLEEHVRPVKAALTAAGNCSIPLTLVILGAYFHTPNSEEKSHDLDANPGLKHHRSEQSFVQGVMNAFDIRLRRFSEANRLRKERDNRPGETKTVIVGVLSRMILTPLILLPALTALIAFDAHTVFDDPVFVVSNVLLITSPPALTLAQITQVASGDAFERLISRTIFWAYCIVTPPLTIISVAVGLLLSRL